MEKGIRENGRKSNSTSRIEFHAMDVSEIRTKDNDIFKNQDLSAINIRPSYHQVKSKIRCNDSKIEQIENKY